MATSSWWWVSLPRALARRSATLAAVAGDGHVLAGFGLSPLAVIGGLLIGMTHPGFEVAFTESLALMLAALVIGTVSSQLGVLFTLGFVVGDFLLFHTAWTTRPSFGDGSGLLANPVVANLVIERVPLLIEYGLLAGLAVGVPLGARVLAASVALRVTLPSGLHLAVGAALAAIVAFALARFWASAAPLVIRPVFTWTIDAGINQGVPPAGAVVPVQSNAEWIARAAVLAMVARAALTGLLSRTRESVLEALEEEMLAPLDVGPPTESGRFGAVLKAVLGAGFAVLFLAGMINETWVAGALLGVFFLAQLVGSGQIPFPPGPWRAQVTRVPVLLRLGVLVGFVYVIARLVGDADYSTETNFHFMLWPVAASAVLAAVLVPAPAGHEGEGVDDLPAAGEEVQT